MVIQSPRAISSCSASFAARLPRLSGGAIHGIVAFVFNTAVLAVTINLAAALFG
ncbi:MAG: hypothetical protein ACXWVO_08715 [Caulobacteraceae bacterium]